MAPYNYNDLYVIFDLELIKDIGISWFGAKNVYNSIGNEPGIYPDALSLLIKIIKQIPIKSVTEIGSGFSTLFLAKVCKEIGIEFKSYEEDQKWLDKTKTLLNYYNLYSDILVKIDDIDDINYNCDMLFIDPSGPLKSKVLESKNIFKIPIVVVDDCEGYLSSSCSKFMCESKRFKFYMFNMVGRYDRHVFVNTTIFDVNEFVFKNLPSIGAW